MLIQPDHWIFYSGYLIREIYDYNVYLLVIPICRNQREKIEHKFSSFIECQSGKKPNEKLVNNACLLKALVSLLQQKAIELPILNTINVLGLPIPRVIKHKFQGA